MADDGKQQLNGGMDSGDITRREALEKMGRYGLYVPATLAVLSAAPRAFAQSANTVFVGTIRDAQNQPVPGVEVCVYYPAPSRAVSSTRPEPLACGTTSGTGVFNIQGKGPISGKVMVDVSDPPYCGYKNYDVTPGVNYDLDVTVFGCS